jgi:hypothetical protein
LQDLRAILEVEIAAAEASGVTGWRPQWLRTRGVIDAALPDFLAVDADEVRADPPVTPLATEQRFGFEGEPVVEVRLSDDVVVRLRGSIDRVDIDEAGTHVGVIDYKTNSANKFDVKLGGGKNPDPERREKVQDLVYDAAARSLFPAATSIDVRFVFVPNRGAGVVVVNADHEPDRPGTLNEILATMHVAGLTGAFPPNPRPKDYCPVCKRLGRTARKVAGLADEDEQIEDVDA